MRTGEGGGALAGPRANSRFTVGARNPSIHTSSPETAVDKDLSSTSELGLEVDLAYV